MMAGPGRERLRYLLAAGQKALRLQQAMTARRSNPVAEVLGDAQEFFETEHYPPGDVFDPATATQYYYHTHRGEGGDGHEHGHFHVFMRPDAMLERFEPRRPNRPGVGCAGAGPRGPALAHIVCIAMDNYGLPVRMFTVNRWVTDETWYPARDVIAMLERAAISHDYPSAELNAWLSAILGLFQPEIAELIRRRDAAIEARGRAKPHADALEDRTLAVTATLDISVERRVRQLRRQVAG